MDGTQLSQFYLQCRQGGAKLCFLVLCEFEWFVFQKVLCCGNVLCRVSVRRRCRGVPLCCEFGYRLRVFRSVQPLLPRAMHRGDEFGESDASGQVLIQCIRRAVSPGAYRVVFLRGIRLQDL